MNIKLGSVSSVKIVVDCSVDCGILNLMKTYFVTIKFSHESFGGFDHNDGQKDYTVRARDRESAKKKALTLARKGTNCDCSVESVDEAL